MQFHLDGFRPGDPDIAPAAAPARPAGAGLPDRVDVLIVGCGPAGLTLAAQLAAFPDITTCIIEQKPGPLLAGQADGIACRTMEMFEAFGFAGRIAREAYWVNETSFWKPDESDPTRIRRHGRIQDVEDGLSEFPHVILNQARVHDYYLEVMRHSPTRLEPAYSRRFAGLTIEPSGSHPVCVRVARSEAGTDDTIETVRARYLVGCDGARSAVRQAIGRTLSGDSANQAWGVMDVLAVTDFPDVRLKALIQSAADGSIVLIPREGGYLFRIYVELDKLAANERASSRNITIDALIGAARRILTPYTLDVKEVAWWSVYEIGQRLCDRFDDVPEPQAGTRTPRVFICGDACHTHSPKAGQGMNVSMQDAFNLGWKLAAVLRGRSPERLLSTYSQERQAIAKMLIDFDREWAKMLSAPLKTSSGDGIDPVQVQRYFVQHGRYTAGTATHYAPSMLTGPATHQHLANGFVVGMRFHSAPVVRLADAKPMHLGHCVRADGRWRVFAFADRADPISPQAPVRKLCEVLSASPRALLRRYTPAGADIDAVIDVRAVFQQPHRSLDIGAMPPLLIPNKGRLGLNDYEKMYCPALAPHDDIFDLRGIDRERGCIVVVRPDQYVAHVLPLDAHDELVSFFEPILLPAAVA
jgi:phenol 2-monooxygenase